MSASTSEDAMTPERARWSPPSLEVATLAYLGLPYVLFAFGWLKVELAVGLLVLLGWAVARIARATRDVERPRTGPPWPLVLALALAATALSGAGGVGPHGAEWQSTDALLGDLVHETWPLARSPGPGQDPALVRRSLAFLLPAAAVGKVGGWAAAQRFLFAWDACGFFMVLLWVSRLLKGRSPWLPFLFVLFSGLDCAGWVTLSRSWPTGTADLEHWSPLGQLASNLWLLGGAPQHALPAWLATSAVLDEALDERPARAGPVAMALAAASSPLAVLGLLPIALAAWLRTWRTSLATAGIVVGPALVAPIVAYAAAGGRPFLRPIEELWGQAVFPNWQEEWPKLGVVFFWEIGLYVWFSDRAPLLRKSKAARAARLAAIVALPFAMLWTSGPTTFISTRASIPGIFVVCLCVLSPFTQRRSGARFKILLPLFLLGAMTPVSLIVNGGLRYQVSVPAEPGPQASTAGAERDLPPTLVVGDSAFQRLAPHPQAHRAAASVTQAPSAVGWAFAGLLAVASAAAGLLLAARLSAQVTTGERLALGGALAVGCLLLAPFLASFFVELDAVLPLGAVLAIGVVAREVRSLLKEPDGRARLAALRPRDPGPVVVAAAGVAALALALAHTTWFPQQLDGLALPARTTAELVRIVTRTHELAATTPAAIAEPPALDSILPLLFIAACRRGGLGLGAAHELPSWLALVAVAAPLALLVRAWTGDRARATAALALFCLAGGLGALLGQAPDGIVPGLGSALLHGLVQNPPAAFGLALAAAALLALERARQQRLETDGELAVAGVIAGLLPLVHGPSFVLVAGAALASALLTGQRYHRYFVFLGPMLLLAVVELGWAASHGTPPLEALSLRRQLERPRGQDALAVALDLLPSLLVIGLSLRALPLAASAPLLPLVAGAGSVFVLLAPHGGDTALGLHLAAAVLAARALGEPTAPGRLRAAIVAMGALIAAAGLGAGLATTRPLRLAASTEELCLVDEVENTVPREVIFLTAGGNTSPLALLGGRSVVAALPGSAEYEELLAANVAEIYEGGPQAEQLLKVHKVGLVVVGPRERLAYKVNDEVLAQLTSPVRTLPGGIVLLKPNP